MTFNQFSFGQAKQTVPNKAAVPVALTRDTIRREYLIVLRSVRWGNPSLESFPSPVRGLAV
ncbi:hypothetical protein Poly59_53800 [Rubripirellula reticaptiva]|uniref:Uncharacterized protein n=1 Tax=Rubripirellula reticaptiva TaxID=2528013 RepID=A0A5C6EEL8_9BACT|nr:hypothetical protein Poly59_53800 [Rubripirellula reticaptiva]